jgi:hypothetical protein
MASMLAVDTVNDSCLVTFVSEPALAVAACRCWTPEQLAHHLLPALRIALWTGAVSAGFNGELVAQILCMMAYSQAARASPGEPVALDSFLCKLLPLQYQESQYEAHRRAVGGRVRCAQCVSLVEEPSMGVLQCLAQRLALGLMPRGQCGADLIIPVIEDSSFMLKAVILVQVKNRRKDSEFMASATTKLDPRFVFGDDSDVIPWIDEDPSRCIRLYMQLGDPQDRFQIVECTGKITRSTSSPTKTTTLAIFGLSSSVISVELRPILGRLLESWSDIRTYVDNMDQHGTHNVYPEHSSISPNAYEAWPFLLKGCPLAPVFHHDMP